MSSSAGARIRTYTGRGIPLPTRRQARRVARMTDLGRRAAEMAQYIATDGRQLVEVDVPCAKALPGSVRRTGSGAGR